MAGRKDGSSQQTRREGGKPGATRGQTEVSRGTTPLKKERAGASTGGQRATTVGKGEVMPQSQQSAQDECPPNPDDRND